MPRPTTHIVVDVTGQHAENVGNCLSSRMPVKFISEDGTPVAGYFTATGNLRTGDAAFKDIIAETVKKYPRYEPFFKNVVSNMPLTVFSETVLKSGNIPSVRLDRVLDKSSKAYKPDITEQRWNSAMQEAQVSSDEFARFWQEDEFRKSLSEFSGNVQKSIFSVSFLTSHGQKENDNINRRNNAMSDVAELLGCDGLIARSVNMTIVSGNQVNHGTFMLNAKGMDRDALNPFTHRELAGKPMEMTPECAKKLADLQTLDYLCGNLDRHGGNFMYQFDFSDPNVTNLVGIQGIDNDMSFVNTDILPKDERHHLVDIPDFGVINESMATNILNMNKADFRRVMIRAGIGTEQMTAAENRLKNLQNGIRDGSILQVSDKYWEGRTLRELAQKSPLFANVKKTLYEEWNSTVLRLTEDEMRPRYPKRFEEKKEIEAGVNKSESDRYHLLDGAARLSEIGKTLADNTPAGRRNGTEYNKMTEAMTKVIRLSKEGAEAENGPDDKFYNRLSEAYSELELTSKKYLETHKGRRRAMGALRVEKARELCLYSYEQRHAALESSVTALNTKLKAQAEFIRSGGIGNARKLVGQKVGELAGELETLRSNPEAVNDDAKGGFGVKYSEYLVYRMAEKQLSEHPDADFRAVNSVTNEKVIAGVAEKIRSYDQFASFAEQIRRDGLNDEAVGEHIKFVSEKLKLIQNRENGLNAPAADRKDAETRQKNEPGKDAVIPPKIGGPVI